MMGLTKIPDGYRKRPMRVQNCDIYTPGPDTDESWLELIAVLPSGSVYLLDSPEGTEAIDAEVQAALARDRKTAPERTRDIEERDPRFDPFNV